MWELERLLAAPVPGTLNSGTRVGQEPVGTSLVLSSLGAASATDFAPSEILAEHLYHAGNWRRSWLPQGAPGESTSSGAVTSDPTETVSPRVHILTLEIWSELGEI